MESTEVIRPDYHTGNLTEKFHTDREFNINSVEYKQFMQWYNSKKFAKKNIYKRFGKKLYEIFLFCIILIPVLSLIVFIYIILIIPNKGKVIYKQKRVGYKGKLFIIYKFRTLNYPININIEKNLNVIRNNSHIIGMFLRKTGLDELLQVINVLKGDMNLIGPRPLLMKDLNHLSYYQFIKRHMIKPGICGLWQIRRKYSNDLNFLRYDYFYIEKQSLLFDFYIAFSSLMYMWKGRGR